MTTRYVNRDTTLLYKAETGDDEILELLWGDRATLMSEGLKRSQVRARGVTGWVRNDHLGDQPLLEVYFIDVGQGDGILICLPDGRHVMIDGGFMRAQQDSGKNAADFVDWKFFKDYGLNEIRLDAMISTHCDADHYGGLWDLLNDDPKVRAELDCATVRVEAFYHAGVSWWKKPGGDRWLGPVDGGRLPQLLGERDSIVQALDPVAPGPKLAGNWAKFMRCVADNVQTVKRLSHLVGYVPGFEPGAGQASLKVLAPVDVNGGVRAYGKDSFNTNGNSVLLRLDYGQARILLTGDLNIQSQQQLLADYQGRRQEFECDVAKACHHGSEEISFEFLGAMKAAATIASSGDNEGFCHPRPSVLAASAITGYFQARDDRLVTPLVYSTELSRSTRLGTSPRVIVENYTCPQDHKYRLELGPGDKALVEYSEIKSGELAPSLKKRPLRGLMVVGGLIYGLVNVRTDGRKILCATRNEKEHTWDVETFDSRFP